MIASLWSWFTDPGNWSGDDGILHRVLQHLGYTLIVVVIAAVIAIPLGLWVGHTGRARWLVSLANSLRAVPTLGLLFAVAREAVTQRTRGLRNYISFFEAELVRRVERSGITEGGAGALGGFGNPSAGNGPRPVTNVVMMGMGEPLLNFDNVVTAVGLMMDDNCYGLSKRRVTISTSGVVPGIRKLRGLTDASLALSLHAPNDELRDQIVPINRKYPIKEVLASVNDYLESLPDNRVVTIEYILISGINDHRQHARELAELLRKVPCKINLIPFNPFDGSDYQRSSNNAISTFRKLLQEAGYTVTIRTTRGDEIGAACGQLVGQVDDKTRRNARHLAQRAKAADEALSQPVTLV